MLPQRDRRRLGGRLLHQRSCLAPSGARSKRLHAAVRRLSYRFDLIPCGRRQGKTQNQSFFRTGEKRKNFAEKVAKSWKTCESGPIKVVDRGAARKSSARRGRPGKSSKRPSRRNEAPGAARRWAAGKYLADSWRRRSCLKRRASEALSVVTE